MTVTYDQLKTLTDAIQELNTKMDERIKTVEEWKSKQEARAGEGGTHPPEGQEGLDTINAEISAKIAEYKELIAQQKEEKLAAQRPGYAGNYLGRANQKNATTRALEKLMRKRLDPNFLAPEERKLVDFAYMDNSGLDAETKVLVSAAADLGGFFAGTDLSSKFIQKLFLISPIRSLADTQTIGGEKLLIPSEGTTDTNIFWSDEQTGFQASADPNLGMIEVYARELNGYLKLSNQNLEDSVFDIEGFILKRLTRQFAQKEGTAFVKGDGVARPEGLTTNTSINSYTSSTASNIVWQDIVRTMHTGKSGYRRTATWIMTNNTIGVLRQFADSQQRPLWQLVGMPDGSTQYIETLYGRPIVEVWDLDDPTTGTVTYSSGKIPILFGDFQQGYQIVDRVGLTFQTLKELFAIQNQVAYLARMRVGGKVILPEAITKLVIQ